MKTIFKEFILVLLLILAILLVLGIFFYDYIPMNKVVPKIEQYEPPKNVKEELEENIEEKEEMTPIVREINGSDLNLYEKTKDYQKGKVNPFADTSSGATNTGNTNTQNGNNTNKDNNSNNNSDNNSNTNNNSEGSYLPSNGTK